RPWSSSTTFHLRTTCSRLARWWSKRPAVGGRHSATRQADGAACMPTEKPLAGRIALITGASRGIGRAVGLGLARAGAHAVLLARTVGGLEELDDEIRAAGGSATLVELDLKRTDKLDALGPTILQRWGKLDILVANAGILGPLSPLGHITSDAWREVLDVN